jgi:hypothetical protein
MLAAGRSMPALLGAALLGSIFPDFDWFYFLWIDHREHHHHTYWTHLPIVWISLTLASLLWMRLRRDSALPKLAFMFSLNGFLHLVLDTFTGPVWWLAPFSNESYSLFTISQYYHPWWLNFILHWSFLLEVALVAAAVVVYVKDRERQQRRMIVREW